MRGSGRVLIIVDGDWAYRARSRILAIGSLLCLRPWLGVGGGIVCHGIIRGDITSRRIVGHRGVSRIGIR
jgi:hypothetical protein